MPMTLGPIMLDLQGTELNPEERERLAHPLAGGVILFSRNYESPEQLRSLVAGIHALREPRLLVGVDHEGGRIQRFREGFTTLPPAAALGRVYDENPRRAKRLAETCGWLMATELRAVDIDFSFAPVLDLDRGISQVIGDRAFHTDPEVVADLAHSYMIGMNQAGMSATGKHFPGHGHVAADSHTDIPMDDREFADINDDILPFERMIHFGLAAIMPAHVVYRRIHAYPPCFSRIWLQDVLRERLGFQGVIFSDDLSMAGARVAGSMVDRARKAIEAGCDMVLVCNDPRAAEAVLDEMDNAQNPVSSLRLVRMHGRPGMPHEQFAGDQVYRDAVRMVLNVA